MRNHRKRISTCPHNNCMPPIASYIQFLKHEEFTRIRTERSKQGCMIKLHPEETERLRLDAQGLKPSPGKELSSTHGYSPQNFEFLQSKCEKYHQTSRQRPSRRRRLSQKVSVQPARTQTNIIQPRFFKVSKFVARTSNLHVSVPVQIKIKHPKDQIPPRFSESIQDLDIPVKPIELRQRYFNILPNKGLKSRSSTFARQKLTHSYNSKLQDIVPWEIQEES